MTRKFRILLISLISCLSLSSISALDLSNKVLDVGMYAEFASGLFPVNFTAEFGMQNLSIIEGNTTGLTFTIDAGYTGRSLTQDPKTGEWIDWENGGLGPDYPAKLSMYSVLFSTWALEFSQGFMYSPVNQGDLFTFWFSYNGRWEQGMERLAVSLDPSLDHMFSVNGTIRPIFTGDLLGTPDLQGNRYMLSTFVQTGVMVNLQKETFVTYDGVSLGVAVRWAPWWMLNRLDSFGGQSDYWRFLVSMTGGYTLYQATQKNGYNAFSLVLMDMFRYQYLDGSQVPKYTQGSGIWKVGSRNMTQSLTNSLRLYMYGPQFITEDCYPYMYFFLDLGYAGGYLNNTNHTITDSYFMGSTGFHIHLRMFGIFHVFYELGYIFMPEPGAIAGHTWPGNFGFYISL